MAQRAFVDTNVLVYLYDLSAPSKRDRARQLFLDNSIDVVISAQVLNEFFVTVTRKITPPLKAEEAASALRARAELEVVPLTRNLVVDAVATGTDHQLSHWAALIVEAASRSGCQTTYTEDLATGSTIRGLQIVNPFAV